MQNIFMVGSISGWGGCLSEPAEMKLQVWRLIRKGRNTLKDTLWGREAGTSPLACTLRNHVEGTSWCRRNGYWFISMLKWEHACRSSAHDAAFSENWDHFVFASERTNLIPTEFHAINMLWRQNWRSSSPQQNFLALGTLHEENCYFLLPIVCNNLKEKLFSIGGKGMKWSNRGGNWTKFSKKIFYKQINELVTKVGWKKLTRMKLDRSALCGKKLKFSKFIIQLLSS